MKKGGDRKKKERGAGRDRNWGTIGHEELVPSEGGNIATREVGGGREVIKDQGKGVELGRGIELVKSANKINEVNV